MGHTRGPWRVGLGDRCVISESPLPDYIGGTGHDDTDFYGGHLIAESIWRPDDARLIAAAPDLLNALTGLADAAEKRGIPCDAARAAILKATGA